MKITVLGSGTSSGIPLIGCECPVCTSPDPRDKRLRPSVVFTYNDRKILIDTPPDFRTQALRANLDRVDAILFTHAHADHIMGLDDVRPFNFKHGVRIPIYGAEDTMNTLRRVYHYIFEERAHLTFVPQLDIHILNGAPVDLFGIPVQPIPLMHGKARIFGYRIGNAAYLTDHSEIPPASMEMLHGLDVLFLDALRHRPHPTHSTVETSIENVRTLAPRRAYFTHISHDLAHAPTQDQLPPGIEIAYDGLEIDVAA
jgi:phosphoribosyl 1,2-cyclic phosphate phosphodiesterase